jgi:methionine-gamma-lyase
MSNEKNKQAFDTACIHAGQKHDANRSHLTPIYASSTFTMDDAQYGADLFTGKQKGYIYGRFGNPNTNEVEDKMVALETYGLDMEAKAILHASGMAAIRDASESNFAMRRYRSVMRFSKKV